jgi:hypothetical protein
MIGLAAVVAVTVAFVAEARIADRQGAYGLAAALRVAPLALSLVVDAASRTLGL